MKNRRRSAAFTMVELLVAIAIAAIVTVGIYTLYENYVRAFVSHDRVIEAQQTARVALDTVTQDLLRAGFQVSGTQPAIVAAAPTAMTIEFFNPQARNVSSGVLEPQTERVQYILAGSQLRRNVFRQIPGTPPTWSATPVAQLSGVLADNVFFADRDEDGVQDPGEEPAVLFSYFTQDAFQQNAADPAALTSFPPTAAQLLGIRQVRAVLTVRSSQRDPVTKRFVYRTLRADVKPRNAGLMSTIQDNDPPATPTGLASVDPGDCGFLRISWNENNLTVDPDLAGYILYYGTAPGVYINSVTVPRGTPHSAASPYLLSGLAEGTQHYLAIAAYDYSGNASPLSAELTGTAGTADTRPDVGDPDAAPTGLAVSQGPGENTLTVRWNRAAEPDVVGYQVYRKVGAFTGADLTAIRTNPSSPAGDIRLVADTTMFAPTLAGNITATGTGFTLTDTSELKGCVDYHYAVAAVKGCNRPISSYPDALFAKTTTATQPLDSTSPTEPVLTTFPSYLRNYLNVTNPTGPSNIDFSRTHIAYRTDGTHPTFTVDRTATPPAVTPNPGSTLIECNSTSYGPGTFTGPGTNGIIHAGAPCDGAFHLLQGVTYYYTAVAVDTCSNLSTPSLGVSQVAAVQCADETAAGHPAVGNPPKVTGLQGTTSPTAAAATSQMTLNWTSIDYSFNQIRDFAGYRVFRTVGDTTALTPFPTLSHIDDAKGLILTPTVTYTGLEENKINRVRILAIDCETVAQDSAPSHTFLASRYSGSGFDNKASETIIVYPGRLDLDSAIATTTLGKTRNVVRFQAKTSINAAATPNATDRIPFTRLVFDWTTPNSGAGSDRLLKSVVVSNGTTTYTITPTSPLASPATISGPELVNAGFRGATNVTFQLEFVNASTGTASQARMSDYRIDAQMYYLPVVRFGSDSATPTTTGVSEVTATMSVPASRGPEIQIVYALDRPIGWFEAVPAPGPGRLYTATYPVDIAPYLIDNSGRGISEVYIYWAATPQTTTTAPDFGPGFPSTVSVAYSRLTACDSDGATAPPACPTNNYPYPYPVIPAQTATRVWFFVLAIDKSGNYSTAPGQELTTSNATYTYDQ